jgi:hypothetical protein
MQYDGVLPGKQKRYTITDVLENKELRHSFLKDLLIALETSGFKVSNDVKIKFDMYPDKVISITVPIDSILTIE